MQYMGGKSRIAKDLARVIDSVRRPGQWVWDPFCGGLSMSVALRAKGPVWSTDACAPLIALYRAVRDGWVPPDALSREEYHAARQLPNSDPLKAFAGFGCSYGGKWFGGYESDANGTRNRGGMPSNYALSAKRRLTKDVAGSVFACVDFLEVRPRPINAVLYLDPPYAGATEYAAARGFDTAVFVRAVRAWSEYAPVFVSEYDFPLGEIVWERAQRVTVARAKDKSAVERLYFVGPS